MNRNAVLFHLSEAAEELNKALKEMENDPSYSAESLGVTMGHVYHHLNTAWNGRHQKHDQFVECTDKDQRQFMKRRKWRQERGL